MPDDLTTRGKRRWDDAMSKPQGIPGTPKVDDPHGQRAIPGATVDTGRSLRCGFGEVIYGEGKDADLITRIAGVLLESQREVLVTRIGPAIAQQVMPEFQHSRYRPSSQTLRLGNNPIWLPPAPQRATVAVVTAGSTDRGVAEEAFETLLWMGIDADWIDDVGVAGPQRLIAVLPRLVGCRAIVVVAGMEGALPSVVSGHVDCPVIAVPTSVGYGAALGGITAMLGMLTSCAPGVAVVNIDAGFKGGYLAGMIAGKEAKAENVSTR
jgi:NCAIR mutase (PurE)-related protein